MDSLVEAITEMVMAELAAAKSSEAPQPVVSAGAPTTQGPKLLVVSSGEPVADDLWTALAGSGVCPVLLAWNGAPVNRLPASVSGWSTEARQAGWTRWVGDYRGLCLLGCDLPTLGGLSALGASGSVPVSVTMAALSTGVPVFCESSTLESVRRHSARLAPGLTRAFEDAWRTVASFGVEFGQATEMTSFLSTLVGGKTGTSAASKTGGRDVVTTEDVEAVRRAGGKTLSVGMGAIVTPLARQQASEWGIEVKFL